jgi:hypothetical protein
MRLSYPQVYPQGGNINESYPQAKLSTGCGKPTTRSGVSPNTNLRVS